MNKIVVTADSTCDLSPELRERYHVDLVPLYVNFGEDSRRDGVDAKPDDIYEYYRSTGKLTTTSAASPGDYHTFFKGFTDQGYEVIHLNISSGFSITHQNAMMAAGDLKGVYPVDSYNLSTGTGLLVLAACDMVKEGMPALDIVSRLEEMRGRVRASFILDTLEYLWKGGRCSGITALGANLLKLKPCIEVRDGKMGVGKKFRGNLSNVMEQYTTTRLEGAHPELRRVFITHSGIDQAIIDRVAARVKQLHPFEEVLVTRAGCVVSNHCGPNTLGVLFIEK